MGNAIVRYTSPYKSKKYELVVTTFQMCVLLLFNELNDSDCEQLSFLDIQQRTKMYVLLLIAVLVMRVYWWHMLGPVPDGVLIAFF